MTACSLEKSLEGAGIEPESSWSKADSADHKNTTTAIPCMNIVCQKMLQWWKMKIILVEQDSNSRLQDRGASIFFPNHFLTVLNFHFSDLIQDGENHFWNGPDYFSLSLSLSHSRTYTHCTLPLTPSLSFSNAHAHYGLFLLSFSVCSLFQHFLSLW